MLKLSPNRPAICFAALALLVTSTSASASHLRHGPTSGKHKQKKSSSHAASSRPRAMDDARATEIQTALVKAGYLESASGHWDDASAAAMRKLQSDNGWQTKLIPDSRALIKLGLGPGADAPSNGGSASTANGSQITHDSGVQAAEAGEQK